MRSRTRTRAPLPISLFGALSVGVGAAAAAATAVPSAYLGLLTAAGLARRPSADASAEHGLDSSASVRFAIFVPAHDEASGITDTIESLLAQDYPCDAFEVHVVADNCADATAEVARRAGATTHVRDTPDHRGKGHALNWLFDRVDPDSFDVVVVIDADTIAAPSFLAATARAFAAGADAVQGFYGVRDIESSAVIALRYAALACRHHLRPLGRHAIGASCGLYGNGMAFRSELLDRHRWSGHLIEDAEFQMHLLDDGVVVEYAPDARIAAEMPSSLDAAVSQHERWEAGRASLVQRFVPGLARRWIGGGTLPRRVYLDAMLDHLTPPVTMIALLNSAAVTGGVVGRLLGRRGGSTVAGVGSLATIVLGVHVLGALRAVDAPGEVYRSLRDAPKLVLWKASLLKNVSGRADGVAWTRTTRNAPEVA